MTTVYTQQLDDTVVSVLRAGGVAVLRTDTLYGIVARADDQQAVERVYRIKGRTPTKPPIVLIASVDQLAGNYELKTVATLKNEWPGRVSIILPVGASAPIWLTRGGNTLAYRVPDDPELRELLRRTGPLIVPCANPEGLRPAMTMSEAVAYFGNDIDVYVDGGSVTDDTPSRLYQLQPDGTMERLR